MKINTPRTIVDRQAEEKVRRLVLQMAGQRLPSERDLAVDLQISRPRLRTILANLRTEGLIEQKIGSGTYALKPDKDRLHRVAVLIDERLKLGDDPFISYLFECLQDNLQSEGARCMIERVGDSDGAYRLEDGAITIGLVGARIIEEMRPTDPPVVGLFLNSDLRPKRRASVFTLEDKQAGVTAAEFMIEKGCKQVFFVGRRDIPASRERLEGVEAGFAGHDIDLTVIESHLSYAAGLQLGLDWDLPQSKEPIGIIVTNDWLAVGLRTGLRRHQVQQFDSVFIVSFDGIPIASDKTLDIHSLAIPIQAIAHDAVSELRNLSSSPVAVGRLVRYPLSWMSERPEAPAEA